MVAGHLKLPVRLLFAKNGERDAKSDAAKRAISTQAAHGLGSTEARGPESRPPRTSGRAICGQMRRPRCDRTGEHQGAAGGLERSRGRLRGALVAALDRSPSVIGLAAWALSRLGGHRASEGAPEALVLPFALASNRLVLVIVPSRWVGRLGGSRAHASRRLSRKRGGTICAVFVES